MQGAEKYELFSAFKEYFHKVDGLRHLATGGDGAKRHELDKGFHAHLALDFVFRALLVLSEILCKVSCGGVVLFSVGDVNVVYQGNLDVILVNI